MTTYLIGVDVATVWASPDSPREIDAPGIADVPDLSAWTAAMGPAERLGLHGRTETQLLRGEPATVVERNGRWSRVVAPWQPSPKDARGYPGWIRSSHLGDAEVSEISSPTARLESDRLAVLEFARSFIGLPYFWGGTSPWGLDCSGLVHYAWRCAGVVVPRDASAQLDAAEPVELGSERPGDLYFFARDGRPVHHVGFVTGPRRMLHAPEESVLIEDEPVNPTRLPQLVAAGRL